jgi:hypothetical protein
VRLGQKKKRHNDKCDIRRLARAEGKVHRAQSRDLRQQDPKGDLGDH